MKKTNSIRNIVIAAFFGIVFIYVLFKLTGGRVFNKSSGSEALEARQGLFEEVEQERVKQENQELDQILDDLDQLELGSLPQ